MATCINCGKKLNSFNEVYPLWEGTTDKFCSQCKEKFNKIRSSKTVDFKQYPTEDEFVAAYKHVLAGAGFTTSGIEHLAKYAEYLGKSEFEAKVKEKQEKEHVEKRAAALPNILISSGFNFEGYRIVKYSGYISGDDAVQIPRGGVFGGNNGQNLTDALVKIRRQALKELKEAAYDLGCNAVIGVDFDYITLEPETANLAGGTLYEPYVICVTANGNAVIIEKE